ncbi:MAG: hypothetical protein WD599_06670, partial [Balneolaceae bacterium]
MSVIRKALKYLFPVVIVILLAGLILDRIYQPEPAVPDPELRISAAEASNYIGAVAEVCGRVVSADFISQLEGRPTFLNLDRAYPDQPFTAVIWESDRNKWQAPPEQLYNNRRICVSGRIQL